MSKIEFKLDLKGLNELMKSGEMQEVLTGAAQQIASAAGDGYEVETAHPISFVAIASVRAATFQARRENNEHNTLLKATGGVHV